MWLPVGHFNAYTLPVLPTPPGLWPAKLFYKTIAWPYRSAVALMGTNRMGTPPCSRYKYCSTGSDRGICPSKYSYDRLGSSIFFYNLQDKEFLLRTQFWIGLKAMKVKFISSRFSISSQTKRWATIHLGNWVWIWNLRKIDQKVNVVHFHICIFLSDPGAPGVRSMGPDVHLWVTESPGVTDITDWWRYQLKTNW